MVAEALLAAGVMVGLPLAGSVVTTAVVWLVVQLGVNARQAARGEKRESLWGVTAVDPPVELSFDDVFADADGASITDLPVSRVSIRLVERDGGTRMIMRSKLESREAWRGG